MKRTAKENRKDIQYKLEQIRFKHIDIVRIIQEEINIMLPEYIDNIVNNVYENLTEKSKIDIDISPLI
jgi:hypothetical protein